MIIKKLVRNTPAFFSAVGWCLSMSWKSSRFYTTIRVASEILVPLLTIFAAFIGRYLINIMAGVWDFEEPIMVLLVLFALLLAISLAVSGSQKLSQYCQSMHEDILGNELSIRVMENALSADVELFDNAGYYDKLQSAGRDSYAIMQILWSAISCLSAAVSFINVTFTYPGADKPALNEVTFSSNPKEKVAIVGVNGSGKSTAIKLLLRMYDPDSGAVLINGRDIREYPISEVRKNFSVYFQNMQSYSFTLKENLTIADAQKEYTDEEAEAAFVSSGGIDILGKSPKRLGAHLTRFIEPDGIELSGGEYQKVALARTFYRSHTALILDEPSSSLDPEAEDKVFQSLRKLSEGKLTIFTSHRLSNTSLADRIVVLENGRVLEFGTQAELMKNKNRYAELFNYQREKYLTYADISVGGKV